MGDIGNYNLNLGLNPSTVRPSSTPFTLSGWTMPQPNFSALPQTSAPLTLGGWTIPPTNFSALNRLYSTAASTPPPFVPTAPNAAASPSWRLSSTDYYNLYGTSRSVFSNPLTYAQSAAMPVVIGAGTAALATGATPLTILTGGMNAVRLGSFAPAVASFLGIGASSATVAGGGLVAAAGGHAAIISAELAAINATAAPAAFAGAGATGTLSGTVGAGTATAGGGVMSSMGAFLTNPWTIGAAAVAIGLYFGIKAFKKRRKRKKAKKAAKKFNQIYQQKLTEYTNAGYTADQAKFMAARDARASISPKEMELMKWYCDPNGCDGGEQYVYDAFKLAQGVDAFMSNPSNAAALPGLLAKPLQLTTGDVSAAIDKYNAAYQAALIDPEIKAKSFNSAVLLESNARKAAYDELSPTELSGILAASKGGGTIPADLQRKAVDFLPQLLKTNAMLATAALPNVNITAGAATPTPVAPATASDVAEFVSDFNGIKAELKTTYNIDDTKATILTYRTFDQDDFAALQQGIKANDAGALQIRDDIIKAGNTHNVTLLNAAGIPNYAPPGFFFKIGDIDANTIADPMAPVTSVAPAAPDEVLNNGLQQVNITALSQVAPNRA